MAPIPFDRSTFPDLEVSSLELDSRSLSDPLDLPSYLSSLTLSEREALNTPPSSTFHHLSPRDVLPLPPAGVHSTLTARDAAKTNTNPGAGSVNPSAINMKGIQALIALIGASMVLGAIWFFFWAKNGGCVWRKGDWEDYKSTVLRRKGPNGTTLSGATKSTALGGGSVVAAGYRDDDDDGTTSLGLSEVSFQKAAAKKTRGKGKGKAKKPNAKQQMQEARRQEAWEGGADNDVRAYRHEKAARVGGLNREADGTYHNSEYTPSDPSEYSSNPYVQPRPPKNNHSFAVDEERSRPHRNSGQHTPRGSRQSSPTKRQQQPPRASMPGSFADPLDLSAGGSDYTGSDSGTKSYHHPIPGLGKNAHHGFRRGGGGRRDSLSDSDGETRRS